MRSCVACGHPLGEPGAVSSRFCPACGAPVDGARSAEPALAWRTDTAERPRVTASVAPRTDAAPRTPPHVTEPPPPVRFPLYADEYAPDPATTLDLAPGAPQPAAEPGPAGSSAAGVGWFDRVAEPGPSPDPTAGPTAGPTAPVGRRAWRARVLVAVVVVVLVGLGWWYVGSAQG